MVLQKWKAFCWGDYFEPRFHAYTEIAWYFAAFVAISTALGWWAIEIRDPDAVSAITNKPIRLLCNKIDTFLVLVGYGSFAEAFLALLCALSAPSVMRSARCACTGMVSLFLYGLYFLAKSVIMILGVIWIFGEDATVCATETASMYTASQEFAYGAGGVYLFQLLFGSTYLMCCGLDDLWDEAGRNYDEASQDETLWRNGGPDYDGPPDDGI